MNHPETPERRRTRIEKEASDWVVKQSHDFTPEDQDAFFEWMADDPENAEVFQRMQGTWKRMAVLADWRPEHSLRPNPALLDGQPQLTRKWRSVSVLVGTMAALFALSKGPPHVMFSHQSSDRARGSPLGSEKD